MTMSYQKKIFLIITVSTNLVIKEDALYIIYIFVFCTYMVGTYKHANNDSLQTVIIFYSQRNFKNKKIHPLFYILFVCSIYAFF